ncbi:MAG: hypothetical protein GWN00_14840 [Aliifodinibius sp.]|nr:hypothetical protein [Phycisphaerae bacterium]NIR66134.1 hypothetical protein [candidate division Zixibacteria bacterium]NIT57451.1 hypothetical protein [Fodinibius sp.]NIW47282.1 hypothetical protein [Gammaproteobacteria bacterium]NIS47757.1 hypothetical protein [candidate division Zixibacteria bacterium]
MAVLTEQDRYDLWAEYMRFSSNIREEIGLTKPELRAAVDATDDWIEANKADYNSSLPAAAQAALTAKQKARLFMAVAQKKFDVEV